MTTPQYVNSPNRVIENAYFEAGKIEEGQELNSEQLAKGMVRLNDLMNLWQTQGLRLWLQTDLPITLTAGTGVYTLGPTGSVVMTRPTRIIDQNYYSDQNGVIRPVFLYGRADWNTLGQRNVQGPINTIFVDKQVPYLIVNTWLIPDVNEATGQLHVIIQQQQANAIQLTDTLVFGPEWFIALVWGLAFELSTGQPNSIIQKCKATSLEYREMLENWDVEDASTTFIPDTRIITGMNRFI